jgi:hypothetical protein
MINGWQKYDYVFNLNSTSTTGGNLNINFNASGTNAYPIYLDDFRVQPFNATMECYVYDPYQLRIWAQLDDRNYATIMEYDNEGVLVRTKKETQRGIYTVSETRKSLVKK